MNKTLEERMNELEQNYLLLCDAFMLVVDNLEKLEENIGHPYDKRDLDILTTEDLRGF